jgi:hypothetical protein
MSAAQHRESPHHEKSHEEGNHKNLGTFLTDDKNDAHETPEEKHK